MLRFISTWNHILWSGIFFVLNLKCVGLVVVSYPKCSALFVIFIFLYCRDTCSCWGFLSGNWAGTAYGWISGNVPTTKHHWRGRGMQCLLQVDAGGLGCQTFADNPQDKEGAGTGVWHCSNSTTPFPVDTQKWHHVTGGISIQHSRIQAKLRSDGAALLFWIFFFPGGQWKGRLGDLLMKEESWSPHRNKWSNWSHSCYVVLHPEAPSLPSDPASEGTALLQQHSVLQIGTFPATHL